MENGDPYPNPTSVPWPPFPDINEGDPLLDFKKILYQAQVEAVVAQRQDILEVDKAQKVADVARTEAAWSNEYALYQAVHSAYLDVTKAALDRTQARAQFIQAAGAAVGTAYAGILALSYNVGGAGRNAHRLPFQGIFATLFLGLAIALATVYLAYVTKHGSVRGPTATASLGQYQNERLSTFIRWAAIPLVSRVYFLHAAVVSLAVGVACLPVAYISLSVPASVFTLLLAITVVFVAPWCLRGGGE